VDVVPFSPKAFRCVVRRTFHRVKSREVGGSTFRQIAVFSLSRSHDFNKEKNIWRFGCIGNRHFEGRPFRVKVRAEKAQPSATYVGNEHDIISQCGIADASHGFGAEPFVGTVIVILSARIRHPRLFNAFRTLRELPNPRGPAAALSAEASHTMVMEKEIGFEFIEVSDFKEQATHRSKARSTALS